MFSAIQTINSYNKSFYKSTILDIIDEKSSVDSIENINGAINEAIKVVNEQMSIYSISNEYYYFTIELVRKLSAKLKGYPLLQNSVLDKNLYQDIISIID